MSSRGVGQFIGAGRGLLLGSVLGLGLIAGAAGQASGQAIEPARGAAFESECVLELRGGKTIRAQVLEYVPGSHVILRAFDGQTFRLPIEEVLDITHPGDGPFPPSPACERIARSVRSAPPAARPLAPVGPGDPAAGSEDEPARRAVKPPVAPPANAAPVASGPPVTMDNDPPGLNLQIADGTKQNQHYSRRRLVTTWEYVWKNVCAAPCGVRIGEEGIYRVDGAGVRPSAPFRLDALGDGPFHLKLRMGPAGMYRAGIGSIALGVLSSLGGAALLIVGGVNAPMAPGVGAPASYLTDYQSAVNSQHTMFAVGGVMIGSGIIGTVAGALLMRRGKSLVTVERPAAPPNRTLSSGVWWVPDQRLVGAAQLVQPPGFSR